MKEYKEYEVMSRKDEWFRRKSDPEGPEEGSDACAAQGRQVVGVATA